MEIIVDSSIWFEYFKGNNPYYKELQLYLNILSVKIIDPIISEILQGALNEKELSFIKEYIKYVPKIESKGFPYRKTLLHILEIFYEFDF